MNLHICWATATRNCTAFGIHINDNHSKLTKRPYFYKDLIKLASFIIQNIHYLHSCLWWHQFKKPVFNLTSLATLHFPFVIKLTSAFADIPFKKKCLNSNAKTMLIHVPTLIKFPKWLLNSRREIWGIVIHLHGSPFSCFAQRWQMRLSE